MPHLPQNAGSQSRRGYPPLLRQTNGKDVKTQNEIAELNKSIINKDDGMFRQVGLSLVVKLVNVLDNAIKNKVLSNKGLIKGLHEEIDCLKTMINSPEFTVDEKKQFVFRISEINDELAKNNINQKLLLGAGAVGISIGICECVKFIKRRRK